MLCETGSGSKHSTKLMLKPFPGKVSKPFLVNPYRLQVNFEAFDLFCGWYTDVKQKGSHLKYID